LSTKALRSKQSDTRQNPSYASKWLRRILVVDCAELKQRLDGAFVGPRIAQLSEPVEVALAHEAGEVQLMRVLVVSEPIGEVGRNGPQVGRERRKIDEMIHGQILLHPVFNIGTGGKSVSSHTSIGFPRQATRIHRIDFSRFDVFGPISVFLLKSGDHAVY
jgi:hypothetical protein